MRTTSSTQCSFRLLMNHFPLLTLNLFLQPETARSFRAGTLHPLRYGAGARSPGHAK